MYQRINSALKPRAYCRVLFKGDEVINKFASVCYPRQNINGCNHLSVFYRDPTRRLGAWENPPKDIMSSAFFKGIEWDAILECRRNGPWIPEVFSLKKRGSSTKGKSHGDRKTVAGGLAEEMEDAVENAKEFKPPAGDFSVNPSMVNNIMPAKNKKKSPGQLGAAAAAYVNAQPDDDDDNDLLPNMRDSVFTTSKNATENKLLDWSFIDEKVLMSTMRGRGASDDGVNKFGSDDGIVVNSEPGTPNVGTRRNSAEDANDNVIEVTRNVELKLSEGIAAIPEGIDTAEIEQVDVVLPVPEKESAKEVETVELSIAPSETLDQAEIEANIQAAKEMLQTPVPHSILAVPTPKCPKSPARGSFKVHFDLPDQSMSRDGLDGNAEQQEIVPALGSSLSVDEHGDKLVTVHFPPTSSTDGSEER